MLSLVPGAECQRSKMFRQKRVAAEESNWGLEALCVRSDAPPAHSWRSCAFGVHLILTE